MAENARHAAAGAEVVIFSFSKPAARDALRVSSTTNRSERFRIARSVIGSGFCLFRKAKPNVNLDINWPHGSATVKSRIVGEFGEITQQLFTEIVRLFSYPWPRTPLSMPASGLRPNGCLPIKCPIELPCAHAHVTSNNSTFDASSHVIARASQM